MVPQDPTAAAAAAAERLRQARQILEEEQKRFKEWEDIIKVRERTGCYVRVVNLNSRLHLSK